jgi:hypothetical protein
MNTAQDIVAYMLASTGGGGQDGEHHAVRQAIMHGVREVMQCREWLWHMRTNSFTTRQTKTFASVTAGSNQMNVSDAKDFVAGRIVEVGAGFFPNPVRIKEVNGNSIVLDATASQSGVGTSRPQGYRYALHQHCRNLALLHNSARVAAFGNQHSRCRGAVLLHRHAVRR